MLYKYTCRCPTQPCKTPCHRWKGLLVQRKALPVVEARKQHSPRWKGLLAPCLNTCGPSQTIGGAQSLHVTVQRRDRTGQWKINSAKRLDVHSRTDDFSLDSGAQSFIHSVPKKGILCRSRFLNRRRWRNKIVPHIWIGQIQKPWQRGCFQPSHICGTMFCCIASIWKFRKRSPCCAYWSPKEFFFLGHPVPFAVQRWFG